MKNADRPAYPKTKGEHDCEFTTTDCHGLTKRELIAAMIASGKSGNPAEIAEHAIWVADELLKQLES